MSEHLSQPQADDDELDAFWELARRHLEAGGVTAYTGETPLERLRPPAWAFGATPEQADELLALVLSGTKTATAGAYWDYEAEEEALPEVGTLGIVLDGAAHPRALVVTTEVSVTPFEEVDEMHAFLEGEGDRTVRYWREVHENFFRAYPAHDRGFAPDMPVVLERFEVLYAGD